MGARTGAQFLKGLERSKRELWLENACVTNVVGHPALAGGAQTIAALFDLQHEFPDDCLMPDPETGEPINVSHIIPRSREDLFRRRRALERIHASTVGHMGRSPDYVNICFAGFAGRWRDWAGPNNRNADGAHNLIEFQKRLRREDLSTTHALTHPTIDKVRENLVAGWKEPLHKLDETKDSILVAGARIVATLAPYADELTVFPSHPLVQDGSEPYALAFSIPMDLPGLIFLCRDSAATPNACIFDRPLSTRFDEQDAFVIFDNVEIPKHRLFINGDVDIYNTVMTTGFVPNMQQQTTIRSLIKLEFAYGLASRMAEAINDRGEATVEMLGELLCYIEMTRTALDLAEHRAYDHGDGVFFPDARALGPLRALMTQWIPRAMEIVTLIGRHNLLVSPSRAMLDNPRLRKFIDVYLNTANHLGAEGRSALFRLAWDFVGSGLAGRQQLYERFYIMSGPSNRRKMYAAAQNEKPIPSEMSLRDTSFVGVKERANRLVDAMLAAARQ